MKDRGAEMVLSKIWLFLVRDSCSQRGESLELLLELLNLVDDGGENVGAEGELISLLGGERGLEHAGDALELSDELVLTFLELLEVTLVELDGSLLEVSNLIGNSFRGIRSNIRGLISDIRSLIGDIRSNIGSLISSLVSLVGESIVDLLGLLVSSGVTIEHLAGNLGEVLDDSNGGVEATINVTELVGLFVDPGDEILDFATSIELFSFLVVLREVLDGGEASNAITGTELLVGISINLSDNDVGITSKDGGKSVPSRSKTLAVSAPRSVELNQDVLGLVVDDLIEVIGSQNDDVGARGSGSLSARSGGDTLVEVLDEIVESTASRVAKRRISKRGKRRTKFQVSMSETCKRKGRIDERSFRCQIAKMQLAIIGEIKISNREM